MKKYTYQIMKAMRMATKINYYIKLYCHYNKR